MDEDIDTLVVQVRGDTRGFASDIASLRAQAEGPLADGFARAGTRIEASLVGALRRGSLGFEDLRRVALSVLGDIAAASLRSGLASLGGGGAGGAGGGLAGGLAGGLSGVLGSLLGAGAPGRATGGPVAPGRAFMVGERGPELFVPTSAGRVEPGAAGGVREIHMTINVNGGGAGGQVAPQALQQSSRQIARAVKRAVDG